MSKRIGEPDPAKAGAGAGLCECFSGGAAEPADDVVLLDGQDGSGATAASISTSLSNGLTVPK